MAEPRPFALSKLICGIISSEDVYFQRAEEELEALYGAVDLRSPRFPFELTRYYEKKMGINLRRQFLSFERLIAPERLSAIKLETNALEDKIRARFGATFRVVNLDPGILRTSSLIMATGKDFSHRIPLAYGIYAHLELMFAKNEVRLLDWSYPDFKQAGCQAFFLEARRIYLRQKKAPPEDSGK